MIVSRAYGFLFWMPESSAGARLVAALGRHCREGDHVSRPRDLEGLPDYSRPLYPLEPYATPAEIRACVGEETWSGFHKITVVRNPWDHTVSLYHRHRRLQLAPGLGLLRSLLKGDAVRGFAWFVRHHPDETSRYYFDEGGAPLADTVLRVEQLETEYAELCGRLGIPLEPLPSLKTRYRRQARRRRHYTQYYTAETRKLVAERHAAQIERFGYRFGGEER